LLHRWLVTTAVLFIRARATTKVATGLVPVQESRGGWPSSYGQPLLPWVKAQAECHASSLVAVERDAVVATRLSFGGSDGATSPGKWLSTVVVSKVSGLLGWFVPQTNHPLPFTLLAPVQSSSAPSLHRARIPHRFPHRKWALPLSWGGSRPGYSPGRCVMCRASVLL
jgi:hypothetical protein